jgi:DNA-binding MarR family transcriptional regulator
MTLWSAEEATQELLSVLPLLNRMMAAELRQEAGEETTMPQFRVLAYLTEGPMTLSALAKRRRVSLQSAGELVQSLVERGWIRREADPTDRRQWQLHLTDKGRQQYEHAQQRMLLRLVPLMEKLSKAEMEAVQTALPALHRVLTSSDEAKEPDDSPGSS